MPLSVFVCGFPPVLGPDKPFSLIRGRLRSKGRHVERHLPRYLAATQLGSCLQGVKPKYLSPSFKIRCLRIFILDLTCSRRGLEAFLLKAVVDRENALTDWPLGVGGLFRRLAS